MCLTIRSLITVPRRYTLVLWLCGGLTVLSACRDANPTPAGDDDPAPTVPTPFDPLPRAAPALFGPAASLEFGLSRQQVQALAPALLDADGVATSDLGGARYLVHFDAADRLDKVHVNFSHPDAWSALMRAWGTPSATTAFEARWHHPTRGLAAIAFRLRRGRTVKLTLQPFTPLDLIVGQPDTPPPLLNLTLTEVRRTFAPRGTLDSVDVDCLRQQPRLSLPALRNAQDRSPLQIKLYCQGEGPDAIVTAFRVEPNLIANALPKLLGRRYGVPSVAPPQRLRFDAPTHQLRLETAGTHRLTVTRPASPATFLGAHAQLLGPAQDLRFWMTRDEVEALAPALAQHRGVELLELDGLQMGLIFDPSFERLIEVVVRGDHATLLRALTRAWGRPRLVTDMLGETLHVWHHMASGVRVRLRQQTTMQGTGRLTFDAYLDHRAMLGAAPDAAMALRPKSLLGTPRSDIEARFDSRVVRTYDRLRAMDIQLPPTSFEDTPTLLTLRFDDDVVTSIKLVIANERPIHGLFDNVLATLTAQAGAPKKRRDRFGHDIYTWPDQFQLNVTLNIMTLSVPPA